MLIASCAFSQQASEKAKQIMERTLQKYSALFKEDGKGIKSMASRLSIKGGGQMKMGSSGSMPLDIDMAIDIYAAQPQRLRFDISGNLGNAQLIVIGNKPILTATMILPITKQFTTLSLSGKLTEPMLTDNREAVWKGTILTYIGMENLKEGKAHKINLRSTKPSDKSSVTVYVLDKKWDPIRFDINDPKSGNYTIEVEKLELNVSIPGEKFEPDIKGYTRISTQQLGTVIMMQIMAATMQGGQVR